MADATANSGDFLLYGATGYTGELIARRAVAAGLRPVLAGRRADAVADLAAELVLPHHAATVHDANALDAAIEAARGDHPLVVLNCAGPFSHTARQVMDACFRNRAHYLDITGEIGVFETMFAHGADAEHAGVMLLPGVGFDVVPSDCLAAHVAHRLPSATRLVIAIQGIGRPSRGTALTSLEHIGSGGAVRRHGRIVHVPPAWKTRTVDFGDGRPIPVTTMPWGDVSTAFHSTHVPSIEVYMAIPPKLHRLMRWGRPMLPLLGRRPMQRWLARRVRAGPPGPTAEQRARGRSAFWAEARDDSGGRAAARLFGPEGYELTARTAVECVRRVLRGEARPGFQTPSRAFGADFVLGVEGIRREDVE